MKPAPDSFDQEAFSAILRGRKAQIKGVLRDQSIIAGIGNAYSDEILHVACLSPFAIAASLSDDQVTTLYTALRETLAGAVVAASGKPAAEPQGREARRHARARTHGRGVPRVR